MCLTCGVVGVNTGNNISPENVTDPRPSCIFSFAIACWACRCPICHHLVRQRVLLERATFAFTYVTCAWQSDYSSFVLHRWQHVSSYCRPASLRHFRLEAQIDSPPLTCAVQSALSCKCRREWKQRHKPKPAETSPGRVQNYPLLVLIPYYGLYLRARTDRRQPTTAILPTNNRHAMPSQRSAERCHRRSVGKDP
jgi:hypothetical protein